MPKNSDIKQQIQKDGIDKVLKRYPQDAAQVRSVGKEMGIKSKLSVTGSDGHANRMKYLAKQNKNKGTKGKNKGK